MIKVGDKVKFDHLKDVKIRGIVFVPATVKGTVVDIHKDHHWFSVEYKIGECETPMRTSFHFADIGEKVFLCK